MLFKSNWFRVDVVKNKDLNEIIEVYNSNENFLINHMDKEEITTEWMSRELKTMKEIGFLCCKITDMNSEKIVGVVDFKIDKETYLSLLMIHNDYKNNGLGRLIYNDLEKYTLSLKSNCIRIDVVTDYDDSVIEFWSKNGFVEFGDTILNWTGKDLKAVVMKKNLK
ncbi:GNAT family N-acetyltransferase [Tepidibacter hydrothermalis]|uniref:GNAT family N-acetyltransferase n=1 Tax=Tepidibacter hydrothermalis TaxID=3036126 RepID=A0ABY8E7J6_9FIRM|nr:GNAT family N-acetyltransferase [Tepidibacter hydrothermalis]WFD08876.1 GNAT family N-acetyltransferase [Tepidibacter hydrothermalis]